MKRVLQSIAGLLMMLALAVAVIWLVQNAPNTPQTQETSTPQLAQWKTVTPAASSRKTAETITSEPPAEATSAAENTLTATLEPETSIAAQVSSPEATAEPSPTLVDAISPTATATSSVTKATVETTVEPAAPVTTVDSTPELIDAQTAAVELQQHLEPTGTATFELNFDTVKVVSIEEITPIPDQSVGVLSDGRVVPVGLSVDYSPDGTKALVAQAVTGSHPLSGKIGQGPWTVVQLVDLWMWDQNSGQDVKITDKAVTWDWSPDGKQVVYLTVVGQSGFDNGELRIFEVQSQTERVLVNTDLVQVYPGPFWLNGNEIMYMDEARFWAIQPDGSNRRLLNDLQLYREDAEQAGKTEYSYGPDKAASRVYLSPDKTRIAYEVFVLPDRRYELRLTDLAGDTRVSMGQNTFFYEWASNRFLLYGKHITVNNNDYFNDLWLVNADGSNPHRLLDVVEWGKTIEHKSLGINNRPGDLGYVVPAPDNKFLIFNDITEVGLWLLEIESMQWRNLSQNEQLKDFYEIKWFKNEEISTTIGNSPNLRHLRLRLGE